MKAFSLQATMLFLFIGIAAASLTSAEPPVRKTQPSSEGIFNVGVASIDITPKREVALAGFLSPKKTSTVDTPLFVKAMVISAGNQKVAIVTLDTLKYPTHLALKARQYVEKITHIPAANVIICASHTHYGPLWRPMVTAASVVHPEAARDYYSDGLVAVIGQAVAMAVGDAAPCTLGVARGKVEGVNQNRRVLIDGDCWNRWLLDPSQRSKYPAAGPADPELIVLAALDRNRRYKAIVYNFACHPVSTGRPVISADYPGHVQRCVEERLGYRVPTLFLLGPCGDVNARNSSHVIGRKIADEILQRLDQLDRMTRPTLRVDCEEVQVPAREEPLEFNEEKISRKWSRAVDIFRRSFEWMKQRRKPTYKCVLTGVRIGDDFALVTNPAELFCEIGMNIKGRSPFRITMVSTLTNGASGYVPTADAFKIGGYETWYGEHSFLSVGAGELIERQSLEILKQLRKEQ